jgi:hypothetical protein
MTEVKHHKYILMPERSIVAAERNASYKNISNCTGISILKAIYKSSESHLKAIIRHLRLSHGFHMAYRWLTDIQL